MRRQFSLFIADLLAAIRRKTSPSGEEAAQGVTGSRSALERLQIACSMLMQRMGDAARIAVAQEALSAYEQLEREEKQRFFEHLRDDYAADPALIRKAYAAWEINPDPIHAVQLFDAVEPPRQTLLRYLNLAPSATRKLVEMRADLLQISKHHSQYHAVDHDFQHLFGSWFNRGFLTMRQITWRTSASILERIMAYESVHPMQGWEDLRRRLAAHDRRIYAFFHPSTGDEPLIFVEVALTHGVPETIAAILEAPIDSAPVTMAADTAVFYSINNSLAGLKGVSFGNFLIKQVVVELISENPHLNRFVTLSPAPFFSRWLTSLEDPRARALVQALQNEDWQNNPEHIARMRPQLESFAAYYFVHAKNERGQPLDPVARFHLGNGASAWKVNWPADQSPHALKTAYGLMINYLYEPEAIEMQHERFVRDNHVAHGPSLESSLVNFTMEQQQGLSPTFATIYENFLKKAKQYPDKTLFERPGKADISYADFQTQVHKLATILSDLGVQTGDKIAAQVPKSPESIALYLGCLQIGAIFLPLNPAYTDEEIDYFIADATPKLFVVAPEKLVHWGARGATNMKIESLGASGEGSLMDLVSQAQPCFEHYPCKENDRAAILYTSGTTGRSKGAVLTHSNLASNCAALIDLWQFSHQDRLIHALPIFHTHGLFVAVNMALSTGATMVFLTRFDTDILIDNMAKGSVLMGVPTFYTRLLTSQRLTKEASANMRLFVSGSAPLLAEDHRAFFERTGHAILERYGMTETCMIASNPYDGERIAGSVGMPLQHISIRITDPESGKILGDGQTGSIEVKGPNVFEGYWNMPEKTAAEFRQDGFFITGDLGFIDQKGYLHIVGRAKDLIISAGYNIYPKEVEDVIDSLDGVVESAVIGVAHKDLGEGVVAIIVPHAEANLDEASILTKLAGKLVRYKQPRRIFFVNQLPRNVMGKVQKAQLREIYKNSYS